MESRGAEMGEEKNKGKRRERKGKEDKRKTLKIPSKGNLTLRCWADEKEKKKRNSMVGRMKTKKTWSPRTLKKKKF